MRKAIKKYVTTLEKPSYLIDRLLANHQGDMIILLVFLLN